MSDERAEEIVVLLGVLLNAVREHEVATDMGNPHADADLYEVAENVEQTLEDMGL